MPDNAHLPGTVAPEKLETRNEWVRPGEGFVRSLSVRLGSDPDATKLVVAALPPLRPLLAADTWDALVDELPWPMRGMVRNAGAHLGGPVPRLADPVEYVAFVAGHIQHPPERAASYVAAFLAALRDSVPPALATAVAAELPPVFAVLWSSSR